MKLKTTTVDGTEYAVIQDGKPIFTDDSGKEIAYDVPGMASKITALNGEARGHREAKEAAEAALKAFEGIEDPAAALKALQTVGALDSGKLMDAEKATAAQKAAVDAAVKAWTEKAEAADARAAKAEGALNKELIGGSFARSKFIADKVAVPSDMIEAQFGRNFTLEDGKIVAKDGNGNPIYSKSNPGELAGFDEALEALVGGYAHRDAILKGSGSSGGGARGGSDGGAGGKTISRAEFDRLSKENPAAAAKMVTADGVQVTD